MSVLFFCSELEKIFHFFHRVQTLSSETQKLAILSEHTLKVHTPPPSLFVLRYTMYLTRKFVDCPSLCKSEPRDRFIGPLIICILDLDQQVKTGNCCLWVNILSNIVNVRLLQILLTLGCDSDTFIDSNWAGRFITLHSPVSQIVFRLRWKNCRAKYASVTAHQAAVPSKRVGEWRRTLIRKFFSFDAHSQNQSWFCVLALTV